MKIKKLAIIGAGNIGLSIAEGLVSSGQFKSGQIILTRRHIKKLNLWQKKGFTVTKNNLQAVEDAQVILLCVEPKQADEVMDQIKEKLMPDTHTLISIVSGLGTKQIIKRLGQNIPVVRAMPNTAIAISESMTCLAADKAHSRALKLAETVFKTVGQTLFIEEDQMGAATALGACGIAFFLRVIRAASQGGIEVGFHSEDALRIAAQTARGAASLLLTAENHPEYEIDRVTTPRGCTIAGLNQMEHEGLSSAMIKGIVTSANLADLLYAQKNGTAND
jgi:pyrroline-5-carboxylate reductase